MERDLQDHGRFLSVRTAAWVSLFPGHRPWPPDAQPQGLHDLPREEAIAVWTSERQQGWELPAPVPGAGSSRAAIRQERQRDRLRVEASSLIRGAPCRATHGHASLD